MARSILILSFDDFELTAKIHSYPLMRETIARLKPVLPEVVSIMTLSFCNKPLRSASSIMNSAILSLLE